MAFLIKLCLKSIEIHVVNLTLSSSGKKVSTKKASLLPLSLLCYIQSRSKRYSDKPVLHRFHTILCYKRLAKETDLAWDFSTAKLYCDHSTPYIKSFMGPFSLKQSYRMEPHSKTYYII